MNKLFVISVGGSLIYSEGIDTGFLKKFRDLILRQIKKGNRFILVTGGGKIARKYQDGLKQVSKASDNDLDWMGIYGTRINAELVRLMFGKLAYPVIVLNPNKKINSNAKILVGGGWKPGRSTDDDAVRLAKIYGAKTIINLSNIDYVYDKDPKKNKTAKKIIRASWKSFIKIVGAKWRPGANLPFDPTAAQTAKAHRLQVIIANGKNLKNLQNILEGKKFKGTVIH
jgi:uridylate kinase